MISEMNFKRDEMKRVHVHISVENIEESKKFYMTLFGMAPTKEKEGYVQWLMDDPAMNFAISEGKSKKGLNHLGIQFDSDEEVAETEVRLNEAGYMGEKQDNAVCCYAKSKKYWALDPQEVIWENYHTMEQVEVFGGDSFTGGMGCCEPTFSTNGKWATNAC